MASLFESFELTETLSDGPEGSLHRARDRATNALVLLRRPPASLPLEEARQRLLRESGVLGQLEGVPGVAQVAGQFQGASGGALVLKYFPGISLAARLKKQRPDVAQVLDWALGLTAILDGVHKAGFLHLDLHPGAILIDEGNQPFLFGFGRAASASEDRRSDGGPERVSDGGYLAPEQTGRINTPVDRRTDYYALGMVFYTLLNGEPAFVVQTPLEAVHAHLAKVPAPPRNAPGPLADIVLKLLAKDPDQRYQSLTGLAADLGTCRDQWRESKKLTAFPLGSEDLADRLRLTRKLFGRDQELESLREIYDRMVTGHQEVVLVGGPSGVGKSVLATEAGTWALGDGGFFLVGKYDAKAERPYAAVVQQVEDLVRHLVRRPDRETWKRIFAEALKDNQTVISTLVPSFEAICGPQPAPPPLPPRETENRLFFTLESFLKALLSADQPVVLLFDDAQWIDPASIRLLDYLGEQRTYGKLLSLYSYRQNEEKVSEGFPAFLAGLESISGRPPITLGPLEAPAVRSWLEEVLGPSIRDPELLAGNLAAKTAGSPFFLSRLVQRLQQEGLLFYDRPTRRWDWDSRALAGLPASENVGDLLLSQLDALPASAATLLGVAACLGTTVSSLDLEPFVTSTADLSVAFRPLVDQQYVVPLSDGYLALAAPEYRDGALDIPPFTFRFQHDRIRQAAEERMSPQEQAEVHLTAGRWLEARRPAEAVGHFLQVVDRLRTPQERLGLVRLLIRVAQEARASSASRQALDYLRQALEVSRDAGLPEAEMCQLLLLLAETAYLCHEIDEGEATSLSLLSRLSDPGAKAEVFQMQMDAFTFLGRMTDALERGQRALAVLGVKLALQPNPLVLATTLIRVTGKAGRRTPDELFVREGQTPDRIRTLLRLLAKFLVPAQMSGNVNLFVLSTLMTAELALGHPNTDETSGAFGNFAILLSVLGRHRQAYDFASLALRLDEARPNPKTAAGVHSAYAFFSLPWNRPWSEVPPACRRGADAALRSGDLFYIAYQNLFATVFSPSPVLEESIASLETTLQTIARTRQDDAVVGGTFALRRWQALAGTRENPSDFSGPGFDEAAAIQGWESKKNLSGLAVYRLYKLQVLFSLGRFKEAWDQWQQGKPAASSIQGSAYMEEYAVYTVLVCAERGVRGPMAQEAKRLAAWAKTCPENFAALAALAEAELLAVKRHRGAATRFAEAVRLARETPSLHVRWTALIHERAGRFHLRSGDPTLGRYLTADALRFYGLWGATAKVAQLNQAHPGLASGPSGALSPARGSFDGDAASLWKVSQAISREMDVDRLMTVVIQAVMENAGARRGWLLLKGSSGWQVVARGNSEGEAQAFSQEVSPQAEGVPLSLLSAAEGSEQGLLVSSAIQDPRFAADPQVAARRLKSVLALRFSPPGSQLQALWYFENDLVEGAFSADRLAGLRLLSGQIGISLENARIYQALTNLNRDLEGKVRDRTAELEERNRQFLHSVEYAAVLQRSLLPRDWGSSVAGKMTLWAPKDIVGGDLYWFREGPEGALLAVVDCTGHGVPGALITVLVHSALDEAWATTSPGDLESLLIKANQQFRRVLGQDKPGSESNDGFDIGALWWPKEAGDLRFAGARIPLIQVHGTSVTWYHGSRKGLGYPETLDRPSLEVQTVPRLPGARYYLTSDGFPGQVGGAKGISLGRDRFASLLVRTAGVPLEDQAAALRDAFDAYRDTRPQSDDLTVIGVEIR